MLSNRVVMNKRLMVVNRGEIATRIFRAATELNMKTIAIFSYEDRFSVHRFKADEAYQVGEKGKPLDAYLNWPSIITLALEKKIDAIHPGYGFLSENPEFAAACEKNNIMFCGPSSQTLSSFGDKLQARALAKNAELPLIPGSDGPLDNVDEALSVANKIGFPVTLKAVSGGGGKGIRNVDNNEQLKEAFTRARSEALSSFGRSDIYLEKTIVDPKHIEVQIIGDRQGNYYHLFERDCSIQRRHQKVVEIAPAPSISDKTREIIFESALRIAKQSQYVGVGTVEFLVDKEGAAYFLEVNPRIQVEHTVTEMITGIDIVQASIMLAAGRPMTHPAIDIHSQEDISRKGIAIQCRITTEDPQQDFAPDTGRILAYRPAQGFGIRLDEGLGTSGGVVTPHYDSLLVKVTAHAPDLLGAARKMRRALKEFRIRGVKNNIPLLVNIVSHQDFIEGNITTKFLLDNPELFQFRSPKDRATKLLKFVGNTTINDPHNIGKERPRNLHPIEAPKQLSKESSINGKSIFDKEGVDGLIKWIQQSKKLLLTDTTMRDAQQSLFATRLRTFDILKAADFYSKSLADMFSLEVWGGATFDTCLRFLKEDPWERLAQIRETIPNCLLQMLIRGDNAVGYTNYPEWVVRDFIRLTREAGLDVFRIFDCLNNVDQMRVAIEEVKQHGGIAEASVCYTGNILDQKDHKYTLAYYVDVAKSLQTMGADILAIKDMAGLLRPRAAEILVSELKEKIDLPIHLHTHDTSGSSGSTLLSAAYKGCDIVDGAISSMSGLTSQPSLNALVASLEGDDICPSVRLEALDTLAPYWESTRSLYQAFDPGVKSSTTRVYEHEIPGGQYSNLFDQAKKVGLSSNEFHELTERYKEVNDLLGNIIKVTPSSKVVGDFALLLQKSNVTGPQLLEEKPNLDYPDSVVGFLKGHLGVPYGGLPEEVRKLVLGEEARKPPQKKKNSEVQREELLSDLVEFIGTTPTERQIITYALYPKVFRDYVTHRKQYGIVSKLPTEVFLYGLEPHQEIAVELETGKTLLIQLQGYSDTDANGVRKIFFSLNGFPREIEIVDNDAQIDTSATIKADPANTLHIPAPMPGKVLEIKVSPGDKITKGDILMVTESMKMEYAVTAKLPGSVDELFAKVGQEIQSGDLLCTIKN